MICKDEIKLHVILSRPQKVLRSGELMDQGRAILFPLHTKAEFSLQIIEKIHDLYCGRDTIYPIRKMLSQQLYHPQMKTKFTALNKSCP